MNDQLAALGEKMRAEMFRAPEIAAANRETLRQDHAMFHRGGIARANKLIGELVAVKQELAELGDAPSEIEKMVLLDLSYFQLYDFIARLEALIRQGRVRIVELRDAAEKEKALAAETPGERLQRKRAEEIESRFADLEARIANSQAAPRHVPAAHPLPPMSSAPVTHGFMGFVATAVVPPAHHNMQGAARRLGGSTKIDDRPAMTYSKREQYGDFLSPSDFVKACGSSR